MERIVRIGLVKPGKEQAVRQLIRDGFPAEAFRRIGLHGVSAFVGSGFLTILYETDRTYDEVFADFQRDREIQQWVQRLTPFVDEPPTMTPERTGDIALASEAFHWPSE